MQAQAGYLFDKIAGAGSAKTPFRLNAQTDKASTEKMNNAYALALGFNIYEFFQLAHEAR